MQRMSRRILGDQGCGLPHKRIAALLFGLGVEVVVFGVDEDTFGARVQEEIRIECSAQDQRCRHLPKAESLTPVGVVLGLDVSRHHAQFLDCLGLKLEDQETSCAAKCVFAPHLVELQVLTLHLPQLPFDPYFPLSYAFDDRPGLLGVRSCYDRHGSRAGDLLLVGAWRSGGLLLGSSLLLAPLR